MKHFLQFNRFMVMMVAMLTLSVTSAWAGTITSPYTWTLASGQLKTTAGTYKSGDVTWSFTGATYIGFDNSKGAQIGSSKNCQTSYSISTPISSFGTGATITKVVVNASMGSSGNAELTITVGDKSLSNQALTTSAKDYTLDKCSATSKDGNIVVSFSASSKAYYIKSITVEFTIASAQTTVTLTAGANGTVKAYSDAARQTELSLDANHQFKVNQSTTVYFTATPASSDYVVDSWTGATPDAQDNTKASLEVGTDETKSVNVTFKPSSCTSLGTPTVTATPGVKQISLSWSAIANASNYSVTCQGATIGDITTTENTCTCVLTGLTGGQEYEYSVMAVGDGTTYCESNTPAEGTATPQKAAATITLNVDGQEPQIIPGYNEGDEYTLPDCTAECGDKVFTGWSTSEITTEQPQAPTSGYYKKGETVTLAATNTFYAVFAEETEGEDVTTDFPQTLSQLLNNNASIASITIPEQNYNVKEVIVTYGYTKSIADAVTVAVSVGESWGTKNIPGATSPLSFTGTAKKSAVNLTFTNNTGGGTGRGTFSVSNVALKHPGVGYTNYSTICPEPKVLDTILISGTAAKMNYVAGETFDPTGLVVTAYYVGEQEGVDVTDKTQWLFDPETFSATDTECYMVAGFGSKTTDTTITNIKVVEIQTIDITLADAPNLTGSYTSGSFVKGGVEYYYNNWIKSTSNIQAKNSTQYSLYNYDEIPGYIQDITVVTGTGKTARAVKLYGSEDYVETLGEMTPITQPATAMSMTFDFTNHNFPYFNLSTPGDACYFNKISIRYLPVQSSVTLDACENGSVGAKLGEVVLNSGDKVWAGDTVTVTTTPAEGYSLDSFVVYKTGDPDYELYFENNQFRMPTFPVSIKAAFREAKTLTGISLNTENVDTIFFLGDNFNSDYLVVTAHFEGEDDANVTDDAVITTPDMTTVGDKVVKVSYTEGVVTKDASYTITVKQIANDSATAYTTAEAIALYNEAGKTRMSATDIYIKGVVSQNDGLSSGAITYWLDDNAFEVYKGKSFKGANFSAVTDIVVNDSVIVKGRMIYYNNTTYEFNSGSQLVMHKFATSLSWGVTSFIAEMGTTPTYPTLTTVPANLQGVTYASSDPSVATIDATTGAITLVAAGKTNISASYAGAEGYMAAEDATYELNVVNEVERFTITYNSNGGSEVAAQTEQTNLPATFPIPTKKWQLFGGWYFDNGTFNTPAVAEMLLTQDTTLYAKWNDPYTVTEAMALSPVPSDSVYVVGFVKSVTEVSSYYGNATYTITDGDKDMNIYRGKNIGNTKFTAASELPVGNKVMIKGKIELNSSANRLAQGNYLIYNEAVTTPVTGVSLDKESSDLQAGKSITLTATIAPSYATNKNVTWSIINDQANGKITVDNGVVSAAVDAEIGAKATVQVTTEDGGFTATCAVTIIATPKFGLYYGDLTEGDYIITYDNVAMNTTVSSNRLGNTPVTPVKNFITTDNTAIMWHIAPNGNYWTIYSDAAGKYAAGTNSKNQAGLIESITDLAKWTIIASEDIQTYDFENYGRSKATSDSNNKFLRQNGNSGWACYSTSTGGKLTLYKKDFTPKPALVSVTISGDVTKKDYTVGKKLDPAGLVVTASYSNDSNAVVTDKVTWTFDPATLALATTSVDVTATFDKMTSAKYTVNGIVVTEPVAVEYTLVNNINDLSAGDVIVLGGTNTNGTYANAGISTNGEYLESVEATITEGVLSATDAMEIKLSFDGTNWTMTTDEGYLGMIGGNMALNNPAATNVWSISFSGDNVAIMAGNYTIYLNNSLARFKTYGSKQTAIQIYRKAFTPAETVRTTSVGAYGTICLQKDANHFSGATFYQIDYVDNDTKLMYFNEVSVNDILQGGKAYLFHATASNIMAAQFGEDKSLITDVKEARGFMGTYDRVTCPSDYAWYGIYGEKIQPMAKDAGVPANRAYILLDEVPTESYVPASAPAPRRLALSTPRGTATDLMTVFEIGQEGVQKMVVNNQVIIIRNGQMYNAQGQLMK